VSRADLRDLAVTAFLAAALIAFTLLWGGCSGPSSNAQPRETIARAALAPFCSYALSAPVEAADDLTGYFGPGVDCVPPDGDPRAFRLGFGIGDHRAVVRTPRPVALGEAIAPSALVDNSNDCTGTIRIEREVPDWSVEVDLTCGDARLVGWFGGAWPTEWR
jgi:hypothetical protein